MKHRSNRLFVPLCASLLACAAVASPQNAKQSESTPRALMERAAFAEEHQRDFTAAARLYEDAAVAARAAGDAKTAAEASAAHTRVLARQGKAPQAKAEFDEQARAIAERNAISILFKASGDLPSPDNIQRHAQSLVDQGPVIVSVLAASLDTLNDSGAPHAPVVAALALANMQDAAADRALAKAYESPDPMVRRAVVDAAAYERFVELQLRALNDPVVSIRERALTLLRTSKDPRATPYFEAAARAGEPSGAEWLALNDAEAALALAADPSVPDAVRRAVPVTLDSQRKVTAELARLAMRVVYAEDPSQSATASLCWKFASQLRSEDCSAEECKRFESELVEAARTVERKEIVYMLLQISSKHALRAAIDQIRRVEGRPDTGMGKYLHRNLDWTLTNRLTLFPIDDRIEFFLTWPEAWWNLENKPLVKAPELMWAASAAVGESSAATIGQVEALWVRTPAERRTELAAAYCSRIKAELSSQQHPASASALEREMIAHVLADDGANQDDAAALVGVLGIAELIPALTRVRPNSQNEAEQSLRALAAKDSAAVFEAVKAAAQAALGDPQLNPSHAYPLQWIDCVDEQHRLPLWRDLWKTELPTVGRKRLLGFLIHPSMRSSSRDEYMVELYPAFETHAPNLRPAVLTQFGASLVEAALPILERELRNQDPMVRKAAMEVAEQFRQHREALAEFEAWRRATTVERETVAELSKLLESDKRDVVIGAVRALGILRARPALPALVKLLARDDAELRRAVQAAIDAIGS